MTGNLPPPDEFVATDAGFGDVLTRRLRRRRRRATIAAASAGAAVVVTIALLGTLDLGTDSLRVVPTDPAATGGAGPTASASARPGATSTPGARATTSPGPLTVVAPSSHSSAAPTASRPSAASTSVAETISTTMRRTTIAYDNTQPCADTSGRAATGWCVQVAGPFTAQRGHPTSLTVALCRLPGTGARAHFAGTLEADFALETTGQNSSTLWHYDAQHPDRPDNHTYRVDAGNCLQWQTTWAVRADDGNAIAAGNYQLDVTVEADNVAAPGETVDREVYSYTVS